MNKVDWTEMILKTIKNRPDWVDVVGGWNAGKMESKEKTASNLQRWRMKWWNLMPLMNRFNPPTSIAGWFVCIQKWIHQLKKFNWMNEFHESNQPSNEGGWN